jgi:hypothetical protein
LHENFHFRGENETITLESHSAVNRVGETKTGWSRVTGLTNPGWRDKAEKPLAVPRDHTSPDNHRHGQFALSVPFHVIAAHNSFDYSQPTAGDV